MATPIIESSPLISWVVVIGILPRTLLAFFAPSKLFERELGEEEDAREVIEIP